MENSYRVAEFAGMAGVTVRTLHHYDRLGLLTPSRTRTGYRLYTARDIERLEQIVALRFLGVPLKQIGTILRRNGHDLPAALHRQRVALEEKRRLLDRAIKAIRNAENSIQPGQPADTGLLKKIVEVIEMQENTDWMKEYFSEGDWDKVANRRPQWSPELQERVSREWTELFRDVETALGEDPRGAKAQALADRWMKLVEEFTGGDPGITAGVGNLYRDRPNWPDQFQQQMAPFSNKQVWAFMQQALSCRK